MINYFYNSTVTTFGAFENKKTLKTNKKHKKTLKNSNYGELPLAVNIVKIPKYIGYSVAKSANLSHNLLI